MVSSTRVRDRATVDYYALLGIPIDANANDVTRAFRAEAKRSHPDLAPDAETAAHFNDVTAAYEVLGNERTRREYDRVRAEARAVVPTAPTRTAATPTAEKEEKPPWSPRTSWSVMLAGVLVTVLGVGAVWLTWSLHEHDARLRARYTPVTATRIDVDGSSIVSFLTRSGERIRVPEPQQHGDPANLSPTVKIRYDPADPEKVILDSSNIGRDITFSIVSLKLLIGGPFFTWLGYCRLRKRRLFSF